MVISILAYTATCSGKLYFWRNYYFTLLLTQQLLFRISFFFRAGAIFKGLIFQNSHFFAAVTFFRIITRVKFLLKSHFRAVAFGTATFLVVELFKIKFYRRATFLKQVLLHSINFFRKVTFWKKLIFKKSNIPP